ncbi:MAG: Rrf2 family transcriptional regulator [Kiritimatiellales bacterium]|jgi:Rrf2 family protein
MKLSTKSEYACLAMIELSANYGRGLLTIQTIAERRNIPKKFLEQILLFLKTGGYVQSRKGSTGGYQLAKPPEQISLADVVRLMDGALAPVGSVSEYFYEHTPIENSPKLIRIFGDIRDFIAQKMETTTFADLI